MICVQIGLSFASGPNSAWFTGTTTPGWLLLPVDQVNGLCPSGSYALLEPTEHASLYDLGIAVAALQTSVTDLQTEVSQISQSGPGASPVYDSAEGAAIFYLMLGIPILLFGVARGFGAMINMVRRA